MKKIILFNLMMGSIIYGMTSFDESIVDNTKWKYKRVIKFDEALRADAKVIVPLEIITDLEVNATIVDDQKIEIPFTLVMNKNPNKEFTINYSEKIIDIDKNGKKDIEIISPKISNSKIVENNKILIDGAGISEDGVYTKRIYMSVEIKDKGGK